MQGRAQYWRQWTVTKLAPLWGHGGHTISSAPRITPARTLENHNPPSRASRGSSANSARGFSSNMSVNSEGVGSDGFEGAVGSGKVTVGEMLRKVLNATWRSQHGANGTCCRVGGSSIDGVESRKVWTWSALGGDGVGRGGCSSESREAFPHLRYHLRCLCECLTPSHPRSRQKILDQPRSDVVAPAPTSEAELRPTTPRIVADDCPAHILSSCLLTWP
jgi:hypothetical protein